LFARQNGKAFDDFALADAFAVLRNRLFPGDKRRLMDMRRSGAVEALAGDANLGEIAAKMANSLDRAAFLHRTYLPVEIEPVRRADAARRRGRSAMRRTSEEQNSENDDPKTLKRQ
jgi:hypothetical protein